MKKYDDLRPATHEKKLFLNYQNKKCTKQVVGMNKMGSVPTVVAKFLKLDNAKTYTSHCIRRSSSTILVDAGGDITTLKRHGGWKSSTVAEGYIDDSTINRINVASKIVDAVQGGS